MTSLCGRQKTQAGSDEAKQQQSESASVSSFILTRVDLPAGRTRQAASVRCDV